MQTFDAQAAMGFVVSQTAHIEAAVYRRKYADIQYPSLVPVDTSAPPWIKTVTYYSMDRVGEAKWINPNADDFPMADFTMDKFETSVFAAGIGYGWGIEEIAQAQMLSVGLTSEKANAARRVSEEMVDRIVLEGDTVKGFEGLFNHSAVTA
jgi:hypothetical protein